MADFIIERGDGTEYSFCIACNRPIKKMVIPANVYWVHVDCKSVECYTPSPKSTSTIRYLLDDLEKNEINIKIDPTIPKGEVRLVDKNTREVLSKITNMGTEN